jgi:hypothetical protein
LAQGIRSLDQAPIDVNEAARNGERVDLARVDHVEPVLDLALVGALRDLVPENIDVAVDLGVLNDWELCVDLLRVLGAHLDFLLRRDRAAGHRNREHRTCDQSSHGHPCRMRFGTRLSKSHSADRPELRE